MVYFYLRYVIVFLDGFKSEKLRFFVFSSESNNFGILEETLYLFFSSVLYIAIILLLEHKLFARAYQCYLNMFIGTDVEYEDDCEDSDINDERNKVHSAINNDSSN